MPLSAPLSVPLSAPLSVSLPAKAALALIAVLGLSACATLSADECRTADWYQIGVTDGSAGRGLSMLEAHRRACAEVGITPIAEAWMAGREEGLRHYCTPARAYQVGRSGSSISEGCKPEELSAMSPAFQHGQSYWRIGQDIQQVESDIRDVRKDLRDLPATAANANTRSRLDRELGRLEGRLSQLRSEQRRFASWP